MQLVLRLQRNIFFPQIHEQQDNILSSIRLSVSHVIQLFLPQSGMHLIMCTYGALCILIDKR